MTTLPVIFLAAFIAGLMLAVFAMLISLCVATPLGIVTATHRNSAIDSFGTSFALFGICMPNFVIALLLIFVFGVTLRWLPISTFTDPFDDPVAGVRSLTLPAITLGLTLSAVITRTLRSSLLETLADDYVRTARAKGLSDWAVVRGHALKNALIPVVTIIGLQVGAIIEGAIITEQIYFWPGVGKLAVDSIGGRDYPVVQAIVLLSALSFMATTLIVDVLYAWLDPRISYSHGARS